MSPARPNKTAPPPAAAPPSRRAPPALYPAIIALCVALAWSNSLAVPFLFDDTASIPDNATIRDLSKIGAVLAAPTAGETAAGRPLLNLSFAINYAIHGANARGYHVFNILCHMLAALCFFGLVRSALRLPSLRARFGGAADGAAFAAAMLWALHPLQTESVTYIVQRAESLAGLFYLLTLYCFVRSVESPRAAAWRAASIFACLCGMASKELAVSAPFAVLALDALLVAGSLRESLKLRGKFHAALWATCALLVFLTLRTGGRGGTVGFSKISMFDYLIVQGWAIPHYLRLALFPHPLVFDYGLDLRPGAAGVAGGLLVLVLFFGSCFLAWRRKPAGFIGLLFFALLAPTSSFIPIPTELVAEHRMYLPLACVVALCVCVLHIKTGARGVMAAAAFAVILGGATFARNSTYRDETRLWEDTVAKAPGSQRGHATLGNLYFTQGKLDKAMTELRIALAINPRVADTQTRMARLLVAQGRATEAWPHFDEALRIYPDDAMTLNSYGGALVNGGNLAKGAEMLKNSVALKPDFPEARFNYAMALGALGRHAEAAAQYREALRLKPDFARAAQNLALTEQKLRAAPPVTSPPQIQ